MTGHASEEGGGLRRSRSRIPGLLLEILSVIFAVVVALAADEWRENRQLNQRAATARGAVLAEIRANLAELAGTSASLDSTVARLAEAVRDVEDRETTSTRFDLEFPDFSEAAWRITQVTDAASRLDFDWLTRVARVYAAQELYGKERDEILRSLGDIGGPGADSAPGLRRLNSQVSILLQLHHQLVEDYQELLGGGGS